MAGGEGERDGGAAQAVLGFHRAQEHVQERVLGEEGVADGEGAALDLRGEGVEAGARGALRVGAVGVGGALVGLVVMEGGGRLERDAACARTAQIG